MGSGTDFGVGVGNKVGRKGKERGDVGEEKRDLSIPLLILS